MQYAPDSIEATLGDRVTWEGSFSTHPLESTVVPSGANTINVSTGTSFSYQLNVAGVYRYKCSIHGFTGVIRVSETSGIKQKQNAVGVKIFIEKNRLVFDGVKKNEIKQVAVFDLSGKKQQVKPESEGSQYTLDLEHCSKGILMVIWTDADNKRYSYKFVNCP